MWGVPISERKRRLLYDAITYVFHWSYTNDAWDRRMEELSDDGATSDDGQELDFDFLVGDTREVRVWPFLIKGCVADIAPPLLLEEGKRINVIIVAVGITADSFHVSVYTNLTMSATARVGMG